MANDTMTEYPAQNEKLSYKFILDSLKDEMLAKESLPGEIEEKPIQLEMEATHHEVSCGSEAPEPTTDEQFPETSVPLKPLNLDANKNITVSAKSLL